MTAEAQSIPKKTGGTPKRRFRNYLLDPRFQLKYTGMVVLVTVVIASALGYMAYSYSSGMTEMLSMTQMMSGETADYVTQQAEEQDRKVLLSIIGGIALLALALGATGIIVTHKVVGPAYKLKLLLGDVAGGTFNLRGGLRKGDELQDVGDAFKSMVAALRTRREEELAQLDAAIEKARDAEIDEAVLAELTDLRERLQATLDG